MCISATISPSAPTVLVHEWSGVNSQKGGWLGKVCAWILRSVPQVPHIATRTRTSPGPGLGVGLRTTRGPPGPNSTAAGMVEGTGPLAISSGGEHPLEHLARSPTETRIVDPKGTAHSTD